ncbi:hypothetical protein CFK40_08185 [Virgibacillus necropolis]|uniref:Uncharacterized protein n=1 Tax=Virgibacillus necropolis TaxID=163877 RepID=A0A221MBH5_9BACI|nr:hypothetical protein CFK40_08185 [Virgibacillus necropolis]
MFSTADRCFPQARLQPPRKKTTSCGGLQTRAVPAGVNGPPLQTTAIIVGELYITVLNHHVSEGNPRRLQRESEDDETPQRVVFAIEEAHREPAESVVDFLNGYSATNMNFSYVTIYIHSLKSNILYENSLYFLSIFFPTFSQKNQNDKSKFESSYLFHWFNRPF